MSTLAITTFLFSVAIANGLIYLCHQRQSWLDKPLPRLPWMVCGFFIHMNAFFTAHTYLGLFKASLIYMLVSILSLAFFFFIVSFVRKHILASKLN
jgi:drug/metabolite transporter (DMT)-like permease